MLTNRTAIKNYFIRGWFQPWLPSLYNKIKTLMLKIAISLNFLK